MEIILRTPTYDGARGTLSPLCADVLDYIEEFLVAPNDRLHDKGEGDIWCPTCGTSGSVGGSRETSKPRCACYAHVLWRHAAIMQAAAFSVVRAKRPRLELVWALGRRFGLSPTREWKRAVYYAVKEAHPCVTRARIRRDEEWERLSLNNVHCRFVKSLRCAGTTKRGDRCAITGAGWSKMDADHYTAREIDMHEHAVAIIRTGRCKWHRY